MMELSNALTERLRERLMRWTRPQEDEASSKSSRLPGEKRVPGAVVCVGRGQEILATVSAGRSGPQEDATPIASDSIFLVASITKPIVVLAALRLAERGLLSLADRVTDFLPEFASHGKQEVRLVHLMTHTSGLPDKLPNDKQLRQKKAPLEEFLQTVMDVDLAFAPGTGCKYQSMGTMVLGRVIELVTGQTLADHLARAVFGPLGMTDTWLGRGNLEPWRVVSIDTQEDETDWDWNSGYWHDFAAPWGGLFSTAPDLAKLAQAMLTDQPNTGLRPQDRHTPRLLRSASWRAMTSNQIGRFPNMREPDRKSARWGLGWMLQPGPEWDDGYGDLAGPVVFGHCGSTGSMMWMDPTSGVYAVLLFNQRRRPTVARYQRLLSNMIVSALE